MPLGRDEIISRWGFHKATLEGPNATAPQHARLREKFIDFATYLDGILPDGRYKDLMSDALEEASMWAHKGIAKQAPLVDESLPILVCEMSTANCNGPVRQWFVYPDDKTPHPLCDFHINRTGKQAVSPDIITPDMTVEFGPFGGRSNLVAKPNPLVGPPMKDPTDPKTLQEIIDQDRRENPVADVKPNPLSGGLPH